jgi:hypothetical protein
VNAKKWPSLGDVILVQDVPTTDAQRELWKNRQPPTRKGEVVEVPNEDGSGFLVIDVGGEYGGVNYAARDFSTRYVWKPTGEKVDREQQRSEASALVQSIRRQADGAVEYQPTMNIYDEAEDGPAMLLCLPVAIVETLVDVAYRHITPSMGLDGAFVDELRYQLADYRASLKSRGQGA